MRNFRRSSRRSEKPIPWSWLIFVISICTTCIWVFGVYQPHAAPLLVAEAGILQLSVQTVHDIGAIRLLEEQQARLKFLQELDSLTPFSNAKEKYQQLLETQSTRHQVEAVAVAEQQKLHQELLGAATPNPRGRPAVFAF